MSKQMIEKKNLPIKVIGNFPNYIKTMSYLYPKEARTGPKYKKLMGLIPNFVVYTSKS